MNNKTRTYMMCLSIFAICSGALTVAGGLAPDKFPIFNHYDDYDYVAPQGEWSFKRWENGMATVYCPGVPIGEKKLGKDFGAKGQYADRTFVVVPERFFMSPDKSIGEVACTSNVTDMSDPYKVNNIDDMPNPFWGLEVNHWDVSNVKNMSYMFWGWGNFNQKIDHWNTKNLERAVNMFDGVKYFQGDLRKWCVPKVEWKEYKRKGPGYLEYVEHEYFGLRGSPSHFPKWGSCPRGENSKG